MKKQIDNENNQKKLSLLIQESNMKLKQKKDNYLDISYNTTNSCQLDNSEFLLNKLKGNKLLQEIKLKEAIKNKFSYYGKQYNNETCDKNNKDNTNINNIVFNIIDDKNNMKEKLNKTKNKDDKKKNKKRKFLNRKVNQLYLRYIFNCNFKCYCKKICKRSRRFSVINIIRNLFIFLVVCSAIGFYSIIFFYDK